MAEERKRRDGDGSGGGYVADRIHEVLDGDLPLEALTADERHELVAFELAAGEVLASLPRETPPKLAAGVMACVREVARAHAANALVEDAARGRMLQLRAGERLGEWVVAARRDRDDDAWRGPGLRGALPARWAAARRAVARAARELRQATAWFWAPRPISLTLRPAYALVLAAGLAVVLLAPVWPARAPEPARARVFVHFRLDAPGARQVALAGDFTGWKPAYALHESAPGVWSVAVPLHPGVHDYVFVIDGQRWVPDPLAPPVSDGFGGNNSRVAVLPPLTGTQS